MLQQGSVDIDIALSLNANYPDALLLKGKCIYVSGDFDNAMKYYKKLKDLKPNEAFTHFHWSFIHYVHSLSTLLDTPTLSVHLVDVKSEMT